MGLAMGINIGNEVLALKDEMVKMRRHLHQFPELGFKEERTSQ
jgi:metal-dependent amidase/aminoacylase/carboxypeptidase family protein